MLLLFSSFSFWRSFLFYLTNLLDYEKANNCIIDYINKKFSKVEYKDEDEDSKAFVYTGRPTCSYCTLMIGNLIKSVEDYDYTLYYLNTDNLDSDSTGKITELDEILEKDFPATPMVYLVGDGKVYDVNEGYTDYATYTKFLEDNDVEKR